MYKGNTYIPIEELEIWSLMGWEPGAVSFFGGMDVTLQITHQLWEEMRYTDVNAAYCFVYSKAVFENFENTIRCY